MKLHCLLLYKNIENNMAKRTNSKEPNDQNMDINKVLEFSCESVHHIIMKYWKIYVEKWMLTDDFTERLGMLNFDELVDAYPTNLKISKVEEHRDQAANTIQNISQIDIYLFKLFITTLDHIQVSLQRFLDSWSKIHFNKTRSLLCKS